MQLYFEFHYKAEKKLYKAEIAWNEYKWQLNRNIKFLVLARRFLKIQATQRLPHDNCNIFS